MRQKTSELHYKRALHIEIGTLTLAEFARRLGISYSTANEMCQRGESPVIPIRVGRQYRFATAAVDRLLGIESDAPDQTTAT